MSIIPTGKNFVVAGCRGSQIGDSIAALSLYSFIRQRFENCYTHWQIARKHVHAMPLFYNHPLIDNLYVSEVNEGYGPKDIAIAQSAHVAFPLMPEHPEPHVIWPNVRTFYEETFMMGGVPLEAYSAMSPETRRPKLTKWFETERQQKTISYWPCAAYGVPQMVTLPDGRRELRSRNASYEWACELVKRLVAEGYKVIQCGHPDDYGRRDIPVTHDIRHMSFMDLIKVSLGCDLVIGTDSGAGIAFGAYGAPQISLLTNHYPGHETNLTAFQPDNPNNISLVGVGSADNINIDEVVATVKEMIGS